MASNQPGSQNSSASTSSASPSASSASVGNGAASPGRKKGGSGEPRKASPKVKALSEVRTFLVQRRAEAEKSPEGVERDIELERFDRMLDAVEAVFPRGHTFSIRRGSASA